MLLRPIAKVRAPAALRERHVDLISAIEGRARDLIEAADVVSEGAARAEDTGRVYYGSTHLLLAPRSAGGAFEDVDVAAIARVAAVDPHVRLLALRIARREAQSRAGGSLGPIHAELRVEPGPRGLAIHVDVTAVVQIAIAGGQR